MEFEVGGLNLSVDFGHRLKFPTRVGMKYFALIHELKPWFRLVKYLMYITVLGHKLKP